jgi:diguanylate cyclase (GGDEF)-like protein/PAS domain S-box-containing protein
MSFIAILDDRVTNRNIFYRLALTLEPGLEVRTFADPLEALRELAEVEPDLVITDFKMPNLDGAEFTRRFRALPNREDVPVIVITVYEDRNFRLRALEAGATDFLQSPVDHQEFIIRARNLLKLSKQQRLIRSRALSLQQELAASEDRRERLLRDSREQLAQVIDTIPALISATGRDGAYLFVNAHFGTFAGIDPERPREESLAAVFGEEFLTRSRTLDRLVFSTGQGLPPYEEEIRDRHGVPHVLLTTKSPLRDADGQVMSVLTTAIDITDRKRAERRLRYMAHHDPLTGLPNRLLLQTALQRELARSPSQGGQMFALHFIDLDRFKEINDTRGHPLGDQVLQAVAGRLRHAVRHGDTVARLGGDEFAVVQTRLHEPREAEALARHVIEALSQPFGVGGETFMLTASIGITLFPEDGRSLEALLRNADLAMYRAKREGGGRYSFYRADMSHSLEQSLALEGSLRRSLVEERFALHFQPQIDIQSGAIIGFETLLRWWDEKGHLHGPDTFLSVAETSGLIVPINAWVLRAACHQAVAFRARGLPPLRCAVNVSPSLFREHDLYALVAEALAESGLEAHLLELEITETVLMDDAESVLRVLLRLRELGVSFAIDDFGIGYSSLSYVKNFPASRLKIDQSFVRNLKSDPSDTAIVRAIIQLGHNLGLGVIAEGVETREQYTQLAAEGCDEVQGFLVSPSLSAAEFVTFFAEREGRWR